MDEAIDSHVHVWTDDREGYPRVAGAVDYAPNHFPPDVFFSHAQPCGVNRAVLVQMSFYGFDNSYMMNCMRLYPGVFSGIAVIDSEAPRPEQAMQRLGSAGVRGFRIAAGQNSQGWLHKPGVEAMWRYGGGHGLALCPLMNPCDIEDLDQMCGRFPETTVIIDHLGRIGANGIVRDADVRQLCRLARHRNVFVKVSAFYALGRKQAPYTDLVRVIQRVFENYGPRHLMWASDCPFQVQDGHTYLDSIELVRQHLPFLSEEDRAWLLGRTAQAWFFRDSPY